MKIVYVIDQFDDLNNGTTATAQRSAEYLRSLGHEISICAINSNNVEKQHVPIFQDLIEKQGFAFAKIPEDEVFRDIFADADLVHFFLASPFCISGAKVARSMNKPMLAAFHVQPKNISYSIKLGTVDRFNDRLYSLFHRTFYKYFNYIHCPSQMIADELKRHGYEQELAVISNGVNEFYHPLPDIKRPEKYNGKILLLMVGRLSGEKRQDLLVDAIPYSKYQDKIQVIFAGAGPQDNALKELSKSLKNPPVFGFYHAEQLREFYNFCDLYIHCADAEVEGISCLEAITCGAVPVISDAPYSASSSFAISEKSVFKAGDPEDLARKIDYWIDHPEERKLYKQKYAKFAEKYKLSNCMDQMVRLYETILANHED
mgnify:CR=1 FL=1